MTPDLALLESWRAGDVDAGDALFERYFASIHRFFRNKCPARMEDLIQETFLACVEGQHRFRAESSFRTYLYAVAVNVLCADCRKHVRTNAPLDFGVTSVQDLAPSPSRAASDREEHRLLLDALRRIPVDYQIALELYYFEGLRGPEIAEVLEISEGTVRSRIRRGVERLREVLQELEASPAQLEATGRQLEGVAGSLRALVEPDRAPAR